MPHHVKIIFERMKRNKLSILFFVGVCILAISAVFILHDRKESSFFPVVAAKQNLQPQNVLLMRKDTFINLLQIAYKDFVKIRDGSNELVVEINGANQMSSVFYNGNTELLKSNFRNDDYELRTDLNSKNLKARFLIRDEQVTVPNDIVIRLTKLYKDAKY
jgi:hypothetical protein